MSESKTIEEFRSRMDQALEYAKARINGRKGMENPLSSVDASFRSPVAPEELEAIEEDVRVRESRDLSQLQADIIQQKEKLEDEEGVPEFRERMNLLKERAIKESEARIERAFKKLTDFGEENPKLIPLVEQSTASVLGLISQALNLLETYLLDLAKMVWSALKNAWNWVKKQYENIQNFILGWIFRSNTEAEVLTGAHS